MSRTRVGAIGALVAGLLVLPLRAQTQGGEPSARWQLQGLQWGTCLEFLIDPKLIDKFLPETAVPVRADAVKLVPALARVISDQPEYAGWSPASLCWFTFDVIEIEGRRVEGEEGETGPLIGVLGVAARISGSLTAESDVAHRFYTTSWQVQKAAEGKGRSSINFETIRGTFGTAPKSTDDRYLVRIGKTNITWDGHPASDSLVGSPFVRSYAALGADSKPWRVDLSVSPLLQRSMVGAVIVQGKGDLAKALRSSPIRFVGPHYAGGSGELTLVR